MNIYPEDEGPIPDECFLFITGQAKRLLATGEIISSQSFFEKIRE